MNPKPPAASPATEIAPTARPMRRYRGSFSTSICSLFSNPQRRTDCCALAYCGLLSSDRTRYLILKERPPPWWRRALLNLGLPAIFLVLAGTARYYVPHSDEESNVLHFVVLAFIVSFCACVAILVIRGQRKRKEVREEILARLHRFDHPEESGNEATVRMEQRMQSNDTAHAHRVCFGCFSKDQIAGGEGGLEEEAREKRMADMCTCLWDFFGMFCCGWCGFWCMCCGMCAVGQEEREVDLGTLGVSKTERMVDYVTFEPYSEYYPAIENLRLNQIQDFVAHCGALSKLSVKLLRGMAAIIIFLALFALTDIDSNFTVRNMLVLLATLFQSFLVLHFVHWRWNKFDLSFDAVVKCFASGFLLSTALAWAYELLVSLACTILLQVLIVFALAGEVADQEGQDEPDPNELAKQFAKDNVWLVVIYVFLNAFVVAALVEELCKYFGFWMVEHPDFMSEEELKEAKILHGAALDETGALTGDGALEGSEGEDRTPTLHAVAESAAAGTVIGGKKTLKSRGAGITIAMVSAALGFACCENLEYVFTGAPRAANCETNFLAEAFTLVFRSMFPIHPLCAAIQSIGVCRRDLEGETDFKLGKIIFVPVLIHGGFDFGLMLMAALDGLNHAGEDEGDDEAVECFDLKSELHSVPLLMGIGLPFVAFGILYYAFRASAQRDRLTAAEGRTRRRDYELVPGALNEL